jgi:pSer/pThr/pTyr-binding forkhead associated (FHA) protein
MNATISLYQFSAKVRELAVAQFPLIIGRSSHADITLNDRWASRRHCVIEEQTGRLCVRDLGSKHGTFINDARVTEGVLLPGDKLTVGLTALIADYQPLPEPQMVPRTISSVGDPHSRLCPTNV